MMEIVLNRGEEERLLDNDLNDVIFRITARTGCDYTSAKEFVIGFAVSLGLITKAAVDQKFFGYCENLPALVGTEITIKKGTSVLGRQGTVPAGRTYKVRVHSVDNGMNRHRHNEVVEFAPPKVCWVGAGGYWHYADLNDIPEAT